MNFAPSTTGYTLVSYQLGNPANDLNSTTMGSMLPDKSVILTWSAASQTFILSSKSGVSGVPGTWNPDLTLSVGEGMYCKSSSSSTILVNFTGTPNLTPTAIPGFTPTTLFYLLGSQTFVSGTTYSYFDITGYTSPGVTGVSLYRSKNPYPGYPSLGVVSSPIFYPGDWNEYWYDGTSWHPSVPSINVGEAVWIGPSACAIEGQVTDNLGNPIPQCEVTLSDGQSQFTDANGNYRFTVPSTGGAYTLNVIPPCGWTSATLSEDVSVNNCPAPTIAPTFVLTSEPGNNHKRDLAVTIIYVPDPGNPAYPCLDSTGSYYVYYENKCGPKFTGPPTPTLAVTLSTYVTYGSTVNPTWTQIPPSATPGATQAATFQTGNTLNWVLGPLSANNIGVIQIPVTVTGPVSPTTPLITTATINPVNGNPRAADSSFTSSVLCKCSFDPNSKVVEPEGCGPTGLINSQPLTYTIQFQNVGTAPAFQVVVTDQLDPSLDPSTLTLLGASGNYVFSLNGNQMTWTFPNIDLDYAADNLQASYGFVSYQVQPLAGLTDGTVITNEASIVFDENPAILTAITTNTITSATMPSASFTVTPLVGSADATNNFTYTGGTAGATFYWDFGLDAIPPTSTNTSPTNIVFTTDGLNTINLQVSADGCTSAVASYVLNVGKPVLNITPGDSNQFVLSWEGDGYSLQQSSSLTNPVPWQSVSLPLTQVGATYFTPPITFSNVTTFFRLTD